MKAKLDGKDVATPKDCGRAEEECSVDSKDASWTDDQSRKLLRNPFVTDVSPAQMEMVASQEKALNYYKCLLGAPW